VLVAVPILIWMGFFLLVYPRLMAQSGGLPMELGEQERDRVNQD
jgi:hypothetical protein